MLPTTQFVWKQHAWDRWQERFPGIGKNEVESRIRNARPANKRERRWIDGQCNNKYQNRSGFNGYVYWVGSDQEVFITKQVQPGLFNVVTCFWMVGSDGFIETGGKGHKRAESNRSDIAVP